MCQGEDALTYLFTYSELSEMIQNIQLQNRNIDTAHTFVS